MPFTDRFQLLDLKRDEGARTYEAREIATGRPVFVHVFPNRTAPLNRALLAKLDTLPEEERHRIIDRGEHEGGLYVVTDRLAEYGGLREWLKAHNENRPKPLESRGAWQFKPPAENVPSVPAVEPSIVSPPPPSSLTNTGQQTLKIPAPDEPAPAEAMGEFTRQFAPPVLRPAAPKETPLFETAPVPAVEPSIASPPPSLTNTGQQTLKMPAPAEPAQADPGEFTRQFAPPVLRPAAAPTPKETPPPVPTDEPGEFTRQFAPPVLRPAAPSLSKETPPPSATENDPGEFTRQFAPVLRPPPKDPPPAAPAPSGPGEFTQMLAAAPPPAPSAPAKPAPGPGEFTRLFQAPQRPASPVSPKPSPTSNPPATPQPGEFTQMLQAQRPPAPAPAASQSPQSGEFTRFFQSPMTPSTQSVPLTPPRPPSHPKDAGEFTQIFGRDQLPSPPPAPAPAAPPNPGSGNATQVFSVPRTNAPAPPAAQNMAPNTPLRPVQHSPGEYTQMFAKPAALTFGQPQGARKPEPGPIKRNNSRLPLLLVLGAVVLLVVALIVYFVMRPHAT